MAAILCAVYIDDDSDVRHSPWMVGSERDDISIITRNGTGGGGERTKCNTVCRTPFHESRPFEQEYDVETMPDQEILLSMDNLQVFNLCFMSFPRRELGGKLVARWELVRSNFS
jgi:hypothetical protein